MKSDFRTPRQQWPLQRSVWAQLSLPIVTLLLLTIATEYSSAAISENVTVDDHWIKLDQNFPPTYNRAATTADNAYSRFFYVRGKVNEKMHLVNATEFTGKGVTMFHVSFDIWRNALGKKCAKNLILSKGLTDRQEIRDPIDGEWFHVSEQYTEEQFKDFELWLAAYDGCEESLMAIKDLTVTYNSYVQLPDKVEPTKEIFRQLPKYLELSKNGTFKNQYFLENCTKVECTLKFKLDSVTEDLKIHFWSSNEGDSITVTVTGESPKLPVLSSKQTDLALAHVDLKSTDLKAGTDGKAELTIQVKTIDETSLSFVQIGEDDKRNYTEEGTKVGDWEKVEPNAFYNFLNDHKGAQLLPYKAKTATAKIGTEDFATNLADTCHKVTYLAESAAGQQKFTISVESHADDLIQRYQLIDFKPQSDEPQTFEFCINDYIHNLGNLFSNNNKVQLYLTTESTENTDHSLKSRKTAVFVESANPTKKQVDEDLFFIREIMKDGTIYPTNQKWSSIFPGLINEIKDEDTNPKNIIKIEPNPTAPQSKQIFSKWLVNQKLNPNINLKPVVVELTTPLTEITISDLKKNSAFHFKATICDEIMECIIMRQMETIDPSDHKVTYELEFDAHPNSKSNHIKLSLSVDLPKDVGVSIDLKSFGDPCFDQFTNTKENDRCGGIKNMICHKDLDPKTVPTNDKVCTCKTDFTGPKCVEDHCKAPAKKTCDALTLQCRNTADDKDFECICNANAANLEIWNTQSKNCEKIENKFNFDGQTNTWTMDLSHVNPKDYDICYKFTPATTPEPSSIKPLEFTFSLQYEYKDDKGVQKVAQLLNDERFKINAVIKPLVDLCFSQLMDDYSTTEGKLTAAVANVVSADKVIFAKENSNLYNKNSFATASTGFTEKLTQYFSIPFGFLTFAGNLLNDKKQQINARTQQFYHADDKMSVYSQWIAIPGNMKTEQNNANLNTIVLSESDGKLTRETQLCKPRNDNENGPNCVIYSGALGDDLDRLQATTKFQIVYSVTALNDIATTDVLKLTSQVSLFDACITENVQCPAADCKPDGFDFKCLTCPAGTRGKTCNEKIMCDQASAGNCTKQHSECKQLIDNTFQCICPIGYESDSSKQKCHRKSVIPNTKSCNPDKPDSECFITGITSFSRLPKNFPKLDATAPPKKEHLYYAFRRNSKLTVAVGNTDTNRLWQQEGKDVCIRFKYFVSNDSKLSLRFTDASNPTDVLELVSLSSPSYFEQTDNNKALSFTDETIQIVCLKAFLPIGKLAKLEAFNLDFVADVPSQEGAVIVELVPYESPTSRWLIEIPSNNIEIPTKGLRFLSRTTAELKENMADGKTPHDNFKYQWPVFVPESPIPAKSRWVTQKEGSIEFKKGTESIDGTEETAIFESAWINRLLRRANSDIYLSFKLESLLNSKDGLNLEVVLIDEKRKALDPPVISLTGDTLGKETTKPFFHRINQFEVPFGQMFKVQFRIKYRNENALKINSNILKITEISFGDPCIEMIPKSDKTPEHPGKTQCLGLVGNDYIYNPKAECNRLPQETGTVDFQCECNEKDALSGKKCEVADYCKLKHTIESKDPQNPILPSRKNFTTGSLFCAKDKKTIKCRNGVVGERNFACICDTNKERFNFFSQTCEPIPSCTFNPCDLTTQKCVDDETRRCDCDHLKGYERASGANDTTCQPIDWEKKECDVKEVCTSADPNMMCLMGASETTRCTCPKGFIYTLNPPNDPYCKSDMCSFEGLHKCTQGCVNEQTAPYYKCTCDPDYDAVDVGGITECHPKPSIPVACKEWFGRYKTCNSKGQKDCVRDFTLNSDSSACIPKSTYMMPACPNGYQLDDTTKAYACDCKNSTRDYFIDDTTILDTCSYSKTICDVGQPGRNVCNARGAGCLPDATSLNDYYCSCPLGQLYPNGEREMAIKDLVNRPDIVCMDVCDLPYRRSQCAAIGAQCNTQKLWKEMRKYAKVVPVNAFCECVSGTFSQKDEDLADAFYCVQEPKTLSLKLNIQWSEELQIRLDAKKIELYRMHESKKEKEPDQEALLQLFKIDPIGFIRAEFRAFRQNRLEEAEEEARWVEEMRRDILQFEAATLLNTFKLAENPKLNELTPINQDVQVVSVEKSTVENRLSYSVQLAVKIPDRVLKAEKAQQQLYSDSDDQLEADTETTVAPTTAAPTTAPILQTRDISLPKKIDLFNDIMQGCIQLETQNCIIPYMEQPLIMQKIANLKPVLHEPCTIGSGLQACNGMSNCHSLNGSTFECLCGADFEAEMRYTFKASDTNTVYKNEYCKAQDLCASNCLDSDKTHTHCKHNAPYRDTTTSLWKNSYSCDCIDKYVPQGTSNSTCTYVCALKNCGEHGECLASAKSSTCKCKEDYYGEHCEHSVGSNTWWIVGIVVLGVLAIAAIGAAVFFFIKSSDSTPRHHPPNNHTQAHPLSPAPVSSNSNSQQAANIRRITAKADLTSVEQYENSSHSNSNTETQNPPNQHQTQYQITLQNYPNPQEHKVESAYQQRSAPLNEDILEPGQTKLQQQTSTTEAQSQHSSEESTSMAGNRYSSNTARSSFVSADDLADLRLSRQTSFNSMTVHEPFTPYNASPRTLYSRRSIAVPIIEENAEQLHGKSSRYSHSTTTDGSSTEDNSNSFSEDTVEKQTAPEPGNAVFSVGGENQKEETSSSSDSETEPANQTTPAEPQQQKTQQSEPEPKSRVNQDLLRDSQEMDSAKFQHVRSKIAAVLKLNSNRTYKVSQPNSPEVSRR